MDILIIDYLQLMTGTPDTRVTVNGSKHHIRALALQRAEDSVIALSAQRSVEIRSK
jgi:hypothetical protein